MEGAASISEVRIAEGPPAARFGYERAAMDGRTQAAGSPGRDALGERAAEAALRELLAGAGTGVRAGEEAEAVFHGLLAVVVRAAFLLHAEARGLVAGEPSLSALVARIGCDADEDRDRRSKAWSGLVAALRAVPGLEEGIAISSGAIAIDDAAAARALRWLAFAGGARIAYEKREIEELGRVREALVGFGVRVAEGPSIALKPDDAIVDLDALLAIEPKRRAAFLAEEARCQLGPRASAALARARSVEEAIAALKQRISPVAAGPGRPGPATRGALMLAPTAARRRAGAHYTPARLAREVVRAALDPLLGDDPTPERILALRVCDPSMGSGAFLLEVCRYLGDRLAGAEEAARSAPPADRDRARVEARRAVAERCLHGVDEDPLAIDAARLSLWLLTRDAVGEPPEPLRFLERSLVGGDSLLGVRLADLDAHPDVAAATDERRPGAAWGDPRSEADRPRLARLLDARLALDLWPEGDRDRPQPSGYRAYLAAAERDDSRDRAIAIARDLARRRRFFHWELAFPEVFARAVAGGFDAIVGNPPWVAYAGRAAQPLDAALHRHYLRASPAFFGYRTLHGLFVHRAATLLRPGGRLGLIVPTSVSDLAGYAPTRRAHDLLCEPDAELPDFGSDAFDGVFQPAMGLLSTRRDDEAPPRAIATWGLARADLGPAAAALLARLSELPPLPAALFGERGFQTTGDDELRLRAVDRPEPPHTVPVREGRDVGPFVARTPRLHLDPRGLEGHLRSAEDFRAVKLLIRQTARYPIAALADGTPFRNSILAGFRGDAHGEFFLLAYLNSTPVRWLHFMRHRDARQGMPQVKIGHLRAIPAPIDVRAVAELDALGRSLGQANRGVSAEEGERLDALAARALAIGEEERSLLRAWAAENPPPRPIDERAVPASRRRGIV